MQFALISDASAFKVKHEAWLRRRTSEHNLLLKIISGALKGSLESFSFFEVTEGDKPLLLAAVTHRQKLVLSECGDKDVARLLAQELAARKDIEFPGVIGPNELVDEFMAVYSATTGRKHKEEISLYILSAREVIAHPETEGKFILATMDDLDFVTKAKFDFTREAVGKSEWLPMEETREKAIKNINDKSIYLWKVNGVDTSFIIISDYEGLGRVHNVYTLPECRRKGYAAAMTASATSQMLKNGCSEVCLYTDASNHTSNNVYKRIGYKFVTTQCVRVWC